jgi:3-dehydroquinate dehydratase-2
LKSPAPFRILYIDGPNLNVLGKREPGVYGNKTLDDVRAMVSDAAEREGAEVRFYQSNVEGDIVTRLQQARDEVDGLVINPGAYTHTSIAIRDALLYSGLPAIEVHLSNPHAREPFRHVSTIADVAAGRIAGLGAFGYVLALEAILHRLRGED